LEFLKHLLDCYSTLIKLKKNN